MSVAQVRRWLLVVGALGTAGIAAELVSLRHWGSTLQLVGFAVLIPLVTGTALATRPTRSRTLVWMLGLVAAGAGFGVYSHIDANLDAGPLDFRYTGRWSSMSTWSRLWAAATGGVGPAPVLAPAIYALTAAVVWAAAALAPRDAADYAR